MAFKELEFTQSVWHYQVLKRKFWQEDMVINFNSTLARPGWFTPRH